MNERLVIKVSDNELSIRRAGKEAAEAEKGGIQVAFDLRNIKDTKMKREIIKYLSTVEG